ncbi:Hypothetical predicted protein [Olea europaea subsp. europaea]|uniref:Uncharacterized protein n=1 Tax=Olea europaea subsp. europaea TaxID=158383 RepID=A0A8S0Q153_OLEEU|nr:Hypothetical predicted protein [Olea europaea subsp. europaea]
MDKMDLSKSERYFPKIYSTSRIPGLIKFFQYSNEAQTTLADLENNVKVEIENLETDLYSTKKELELMERAQGLLELEKLKLEDEFRRSQREYDALKEKITSLTEDVRVSIEREKRNDERYAEVCDELKRSQIECDELKEKFTRFVEDKKVSSDREKRTEEQHAKVCDELKRCQKECNELKEKNIRLLEDRTVSRDRERRTEERYAKLYDEYSKAENEKHKIILHLNERIKELKNQKLGSQQAAEMYREKIKSLDLRVSQMNWEVEKLKRENSEADQIVEELRCKKLEADHTVEVYKKKFEDLSSRFGNTEQILAKIFKVGVNDLSNLATNIENDVSFSTCDCEKDSSGNGGKRSGGNDDFENLDLEHFENERSPMKGADAGDTLPIAHSACKYSGTGFNGLQERGRRAINVTLDHGERVAQNLMLCGSSLKVAQSLKAGDIVEISDSDDEATPKKILQNATLSQSNREDRADSTPKRKRSTYGCDNDENFQFGAQQAKGIQEVKYEGSGSLVNNLVKPKSVDANLAQTVLPSMHNLVLIRRHEEKAEAKGGSQAPSQVSDDINVNASTDSEDESFSSSCINNMVGSVQGKKKSKA